ncbi:MAG: ATPase domain-containing protein [Candidatus Altiarchaeota archaeon]
MAKSSVERIGTGVPGLDPLIGGGIPRGFSALITGYAGTGKTVMALQMLTCMAAAGEKCLYLTFEESVEKLVAQAESFSWNIDKIFGKSLKLASLKDYTKDQGSLIEMISSDVRDGVTVLAVDSLSMLTGAAYLLRSNASKDLALVSDERDFVLTSEDVRREHITSLIKDVSSLGVTSIWIAEAHPSIENVLTITTDGVSEYQCDGVIFLEKRPDGSRRLYIEKMRLTKTEDKPYHMYFIDEGIGVNPMGVRQG